MKILVTGASGFLGSSVMPCLKKAGHEVFDPDSVELDLMDEGALQSFIRNYTPEAIVHLAANCGGIQYNRKHPADLWYDNTIMGACVLDVSSEYRSIIKRVVLMATTCGYPRTPKTIPFVEEELWDGIPEPTNASYGIAKRSLAYAAQAYRRQYDLDVRVLVPTNLYGPHDHFMEPERSHVIPGLMRRLDEASRLPTPHLTIWGTGQATRDFLYVEDCAEAIRLTVEKPDWPAAGGPINLGSGQEVSISDLVFQIAKVMGFQGSISWDPDKPDGQPRRCLNTRKAFEVLKWAAATPLVTGLEKTWAHYKEALYD